jgi:hypothetical protein
MDLSGFEPRASSMPRGSKIEVIKVDEYLNITRFKE